MEGQVVEEERWKRKEDEEEERWKKCVEIDLQDNDMDQHWGPEAIFVNFVAFINLKIGLGIP